MGAVKLDHGHDQACVIFRYDPAQSDVAKPETRISDEVANICESADANGHALSGRGSLSQAVRDAH
jgi:hypothetical protein